DPWQAAATRSRALRDAAAEDPEREDPSPRDPRRVPREAGSRRPVIARQSGGGRGGPRPREALDERYRRAGLEKERREPGWDVRERQHIRMKLDARRGGGACPRRSTYRAMGSGFPGSP